MNKDDQENPYLGLGGAYILMLGITVGLPTTIVGIPLWDIGGSRKNKAEMVLKKLDIKPENSMAVGLGITIRF